MECNKILIGKKLGMMSFVDEGGVVIPATVMKIVDSQVIEIKQKDKHGYNAVVVGFVNSKFKNVKKPMIGHLKKLNAKDSTNIVEFRVADIGSYELLKDLAVDQFTKGDKVTVTGNSIGKGFAGTIKRHNFSRGPMSHGSKNHRLPGSIGAGTDPGRVLKGTKMSGRYGNVKTTIKNLEIIKVDADKGLIILSGSVPGKPDNILKIYS
ncbi:50S ribosomal protein L3 [Candidatus Marinamargulisbacteria bacterium SCGC AG-410-N11]|nr:50S ribosomal protein L3 [Candidatus Marinamargulisbacteria bacterium SCGC AG-410-N11]